MKGSTSDKKVIKLLTLTPEQIQRVCDAANLDVSELDTAIKTAIEGYCTIIEKGTLHTALGALKQSEARIKKLESCILAIQKLIPEFGDKSSVSELFVKAAMKGEEAK